MILWDKIYKTIIIIQWMIEIEQFSTSLHTHQPLRSGPCMCVCVCVCVCGGGGTEIDCLVRIHKTNTVYMAT